MQPGTGDGFAADPVRLREAAGAVHACGTDVADAAASARGPVATAAAASGGPRLSAALGAFERELTTRSGACAETLRAAGAGLVRTAEDVEAADRFPSGAPGSAGGREIREALG